VYGDWLYTNKRNVVSKIEREHSNEREEDLLESRRESLLYEY
jgi:hypothetical protein